MKEGWVLIFMLKAFIFMLPFCAARLHVSIDLHASIPSPTRLLSYAHGFSSYARGFSIYAIGFCAYANPAFFVLPLSCLCSMGQVRGGGGWIVFDFMLAGVRV